MSGLSRLVVVLLLSGISMAASAWQSYLAVPDPVPPKVTLSVPADALRSAAKVRLRLDGSAQQKVEVDLRFELPLAGDRRWMLWMARDPFDEVGVTGLDGRRRASGFFRPDPEEGRLPAGFAFALPGDSVGMQRLRLDVRGSVRSASIPQILSEREVLGQASREVALACAIYAALATLLMASLALYPAVRDPIFLLFAGYLATALLFVATMGGHVYAWPAGRLLGDLGVRGFWLVSLAFNALSLLTLIRFADVRASRSAWLRRLDWVVVAMAALVVLPMLPLGAAAGALQPIATAAWMLSIPLGMLATVDGARRGVQMAVAASVALFVLLLALVAHEGMQRGWLEDSLLTRHGYQLVLVLVAVVLFTGLSTRIGEVRQRLVDETRARRQSDVRLRQQRARAGLAQSLKDRLRGVAEDAIAPTACRLLADHAIDMLGHGAAVVVGGAYLGHELLLVQPEAQSRGFAQELLRARSLIRHHASDRTPILLRLEGSRQSEDTRKPLRAIVPLQLASPAWAALVVHAVDAAGFDDTTLAALMDLARLTVLHADEAHAALQLRRTAEHDSLTGTLNRRSLDQLLARAFRPGASAATALAVLFIDIDGFKRTNDQLGHACGDLCLRSIARCLRGELRPADALGRYGGDEFLVLLPGRDAAAARLIAERLREAVETIQVHWQGQAMDLTVSIGLAVRREDDNDPSALLARADKALYAAKEQGRNRVCVAPAPYA